jgi:membrane protease YdiL (CAAX protease family)
MLILGLVTLLIFPIPTFLVMYFLHGVNPWSILQFQNFTVLNVGLGLQFGFFYGIIALGFLQAPVFEKLPNKIDHLVRSMNLTKLDALFLSFCAGFGEELLFRSGLQFYLGTIITSILFVAIHGYLNPMNWRFSLYGLIVLPFILLLSFGFDYFGLWFAISAHFAYDAVLFLSMLRNNKNT